MQDLYEEKAGTGWGVLLVDARNAFNSVNSGAFNLKAVWYLAEKAFLHCDELPPMADVDVTASAGIWDHGAVIVINPWLVLASCNHFLHYCYSKCNCKSCFTYT